jgi:hypothetical protein
MAETLSMKMVDPEVLRLQHSIQAKKLPNAA